MVFLYLGREWSLLVFSLDNLIVFLLIFFLIRVSMPLGEFICLPKEDPGMETMLVSLVSPMVCDSETPIVPPCVLYLSLKLP